MAPSYRSGTLPAVPADNRGGMVAFGGSRNDLSGQNSKAASNSMWDRRRRRSEKKTRVDNHHDEPDKDFGDRMMRGGRARNSRSHSRQQHEFEDEDLDPYDSDPGESYRQHCMKMNGIGTKTCLGVPGFLKNSKSRTFASGEGETVLTAPPSPMQSEMGDLFGQIPASLPPNATRVRYSLRSSITDGAEKQPTGPTVMERRELRPNNVHLNVSHWSDTGGRPYMEDR